MHLRKATLSDRDLVFKWANDPEVRRNSFHQELIEYENHCRWYEQVLANVDEQLFILEDQEIPVGQIRLSIHDTSAEISYSIAPDKRGMGYGSKSIELIRERVRIDHPEIVRLVAKVKSGNEASVKCFRKNGFQESYSEYEFYL